MSDQKRGQRYHSEPNEGWYALLAQPNALTRLPQIVAEVAADAPEWAKADIVHDNGDTDMAAYAAIHEAYAPEVAKVEALLSQGDALSADMDAKYGPLPPELLIGTMSTILEMPSEKYPNGREWFSDGVRTCRIDQEYVDAQKALADERQRLEREVVDAALASRRAYLDCVKARRRARDVDWLITPMDADMAFDVCMRGEEAAVDALAAFLEAQGEEK